MKITDIVQQKRNKKRYNIYIDDEYYCSLDVEQMVLHQIKIGKTFEQFKLDQIIKADNLNYGFNLAIKYISYKRRTIKETYDYLCSKGLLEVAAKSAIKKVEDYGYLNDLEYANEYVSFQINQAKYGSMYIINKLKQKGIDEQIIEKAMKVLVMETELKICWGVFAKLFKKYQDKDKLKAKVAIQRSLVSKGFTFEVIENIIRTTNFEENV